MVQDDDLAFLAGLLAGQTEEDPRVRPIPSRRLDALARRPAAMTGGEMAALLLSPRTRAALAARRAPPRPSASGPADDDRHAFEPASFAAHDGGTDRFVLEAPHGTLEVRPGPDADVPYVLVLRLDPAVPGGAAGRRVVVWEAESGRVWADGSTDASGVLHAPWPFGAARPRDRLRGDALRFALGEEPTP